MNKRQEFGAGYVLKRLLQYLRPYTPYVALGVVGVVITQVLAVTIPQVLRFVIDRGVAQQDRDYMLQAGLLVIGLGTMRGVGGFLARYFTESQSHRVAYDIRNDLYNKVQRLPFSYHDRARTGSLITRAISDVDEIQRFLAFGVFDGMNTFLVISFSTVMMFLTSPLLAAIALVPLLPLVARSMGFARQVDRGWRRVMESLSDLGDHLQESIVGAEVVRAFNREDYEINNFRAENQKLYQRHMDVFQSWITYVPFSAMLIASSISLTLIFGALFEQTGFAGVTVGVVVQFNAYILLMAQPIRFLGFVIMLVNQGISSGRRVFEVLDEENSLVDVPHAQPLPKDAQGVVRFEGVSFRFEEHAPLALKNIHMTAGPDQIVALIGKTGAGKSALVNLIPRFYEVSTGRVTIDDVDVRYLSLESLRRHIGVVLQESLLFSASIKENIALGNPDATMDDIIDAAKAADAHDFIMEFPEQYDTLVGERGVTLSGGQRQRVAIARAIIMDPPIMILDDATSSVDTDTEYRIQQALKKIMRGRTVFVVAQRLSSVLHADQILVMDKGEIVERGTHQELLAVDGVYKEIYNLQLADQERVRRETLRYEDMGVGAIGD